MVQHFNSRGHQRSSVPPRGIITPGRQEQTDTTLVIRDKESQQEGTHPPTPTESTAAEEEDESRTTAAGSSKTVFLQTRLRNSHLILLNHRGGSAAAGGYANVAHVTHNLNQACVFYRFTSINAAQETAESAGIRAESKHESCLGLKDANQEHSVLQRDRISPQRDTTTFIV